MRLIVGLLLAILASFSFTAITAKDELPRMDYWVPVASVPRFTGKYISSRPGGLHQRAQSFEVMDPFQLTSAQHLNVLLYGNVLLQPSFPSTTGRAVQSALRAALKRITTQAKEHISADMEIEHAVMTPLYATGDNGATELVIMQSYMDRHQRLQRFQSYVTFGTNFYLTLRDEKFGLRHRIAVALDREARHNVLQHTFSSLYNTKDTSSSNCDGETCQQSADPPRILTYNVWNTNPPGVVYGFSNRWPQYWKRMNHFIQTVLETKANIIGLEEVRYDSTLGHPGGHSQIEHLTSHLPGYQFVYQAAMSYMNTNSPHERVEEGPAILSKFPIVETDYLLLSRDPNDPNDSHQRLCLHAVVNVPEWGLVDVYVSHLSLAERSREKTMVEIWEYMKQGRGVTQVLLGDLNAEPHSRGIKFLRGEETLAGETTDLEDAWLQVHSEPMPGSKDETDRLDKFTFPSDDPIKRIDYILYRGKGQVQEAQVVGQYPTEDTTAYPTYVGMLERDSPVYASDHRGVVVELHA